MRAHLSHSNHAEPGLGTRQSINPNWVFRRLAGRIPGLGLGLAIVPLAAPGQANYATPYTFTTIARNPGYGSADGTNSAAQFAYPCGVAVDSATNLYVADTVNSTIRKGLPASCVPSPLLQPPSLSAGQFGFGITGVPNLPLSIEASPDLINWQMMGTCCLGGATNCFVCLNPRSGTEFYRAQVR